MDVRTILDLAHVACEAAMEAGAEFVDVSVGEGKSQRVELENSAVKSTDVRWFGGASVRAYVEGGCGWASTSGIKEENLLTAAVEAAALAKAAEPDPDFVSLPSPAQTVEVADLWDDRVAELSIKELVAHCGNNIEAARAVAEDVIVAGGAHSGFHRSALVNSLGVEVEQTGTFVGLSIFAILKRGDDVGSYFEFDTGCCLEDFEPEGIGASAARDAVRFLGARKITTETLPVVFGPLSASSLFGALCHAANAEDIQRNRSYLAGMKGRRVASDLVTLTDEPLIPRGLSSAPADGEGVPHRTLAIVADGILLTYLHDSYTANKAKEPNTGHSTRGGISPTNIIPRLGDRTAAEIIRDTAEGLYVNMGSVSPNPVTGDISATVDFGFKIENGELAYPVKNTMFGIHVLDLLRNIDAISSDYRSEPGAIMPTVRAQGVRVAGGE